MARKRPAPKYARALAHPIYVDQDAPEYHRYPDVTETLKEMWQTRAAEKMLLLFKHYKIDPSDEQSWQKLAFSLAFENVPGLKLAFRPKPGRKPTWKTGLGDELVRAVEDVKSRTGKGTKDAIAKLKGGPGGKWGRYTVENLITRYREAKRHQEQFRKIVEAALSARRKAQGQAAFARAPLRHVAALAALPFHGLGLGLAVLGRLVGECALLLWGVWPIFVFAPFEADGPSGNDVVVDFEESDRLDLTAFGTTFRDLDDDRDGRLEAGEGDETISVSFDGDDTLLSFADGSIRIEDVVRLRADDFIF